MEPEKPKPSPEPARAEPDLKGTTDFAPPSDSHARFADGVHQYVREYIRYADQKATFYFTTTTALLAFLHSKDTATRWLKPPSTWNPIDALALLAVVSLGAAAVALLSVVFPRLKGSSKGILYFNAIAAYQSPAEYADQVLRRPSTDFARVQLQHAYELSQICHQKYRTLIIALYIGAVGMGATVLYFVLGLPPPVKP